MPDPTNKDIIILLEEHEKAIASLYAEFRACLPEMKSVWDKLVHEELAHAEVLRLLHKLLESREVFLNTRKFNIAAVQTSLDYIKPLIVKTHADGITALRALSFALNFEQAMIEKEFFSVFETDIAEIRNQFQTLRNHTISHKKMLEEYLEAEKKKTNS